MSLLANKNWHWQAVTQHRCDVLLLLSTDMKQPLALNNLPDACECSAHPVKRVFSFPLLNISPYTQCTTSKTDGGKEIRGNKLQGRFCKFQDGERKCQGDFTSQQKHEEERKEDVGTGRGDAVPWHPTSVGWVSLSVQVWNQTQSTLPIQTDTPFISVPFKTRCPVNDAEREQTLGHQSFNRPHEDLKNWITCPSDRVYDVLSSL